MADTAAKKPPSPEEIRRARHWAAFKISLAKQNYTPTPNEILEARIADVRLTLEERADALLQRKSVGNWMNFACEMDWDTCLPTSFLTQSDFARILIPQVDAEGNPLPAGEIKGKQRINAWAKLRERQGYLKIGDGQNPRLLILVFSPRPVNVAPAPPAGPEWGEFEPRWIAEHPIEYDMLQKAETALKKLEEKAKPHRETVAEIKGAMLSAFKKLQDEARPAAAGQKSEEAQPALDFGLEPPSPVMDISDLDLESSGLSITEVNDVSDIRLPDVPTFSGPRSHGHGIDPRARILNSKQLHKENHPSVGRSSSIEEPTDRPTGGADSESGYKPKIREWLEKNVKLPVAIEDPELDQIAATIQTDSHFEQFQKAARKQKDPRGWKVYVKIARECQKHQEKYSAAAAGSSEEAGDQKGESSLAEMMRIRKELEDHGR